MRKIINREDVVQAALTIERWCAENICSNCPLDIPDGCALAKRTVTPAGWGLEEFLRTRGMKHD